MVKEEYKETLIGVLPKDWNVDKIGNVINVLSGYGFKSSEFVENGINIVKIGSMQNGSIIVDDKSDFLPEKYYDEYKKYQLEDGDVLIALSGATTGKIAVFDSEIGKALLNQRVGKFEAKSNKLEKKFMRYFVDSHSFYRYVLSRMGRSAQGNLSPTKLKKTHIPLPPLFEQKKIASILSSVDKSIEKTDKVIEETKELKKGLMQELLTKGIGHSEFKKVRVGPINYEIPINWKTEKLGDISKVKRGASPRPIASDKWFDENSNIGWVRISDITSAGKYLKETEQYLSSAGIDKSRKANKGEVILSICATVGKPSILDIDTCIHDGLVLFRNNKDKILNEFLYYVLLRNQQILKSKGQTGTQANLNTSIVKRTEILLPPLEEQKKIVSILSSVDAKIKKEEEYKAKLERLKKGLMQKLLTGEIRVNTEMEV